MSSGNRAQPTDPPAASLRKLLSDCHWQAPVGYGHAQLMSWRTTLALAMSGVQLDPVARQVWPTLVRSADQVTGRLLADVSDRGLGKDGLGFRSWLTLWRMQFDHWTDPVRNLVCQQVEGDEAESLVAILSQADGFVFADFVLAAVVAHSEREAFRARLLDRPEPARALPRMLGRARLSRAPAMNWAVQYLYARFQHHAAFRTEPAPAVAIAWSDVAEIYHPQTEADLADRENHS